jgi:anti-anti-sigma factor
MEISVSQQQGRVPVTVFHIKGDITHETFEQLQHQAQQAIQAGARQLLLDLSDVSYVSSYGIRGISQIFTLFRDAAQDESEETVKQGLRDGSFKSAHLKLLKPSRQVQKVLTMAGLDMFLEIHSNLTDAVASF